MIRSMTGYGSAAGEIGALQISVEIRTVNHRFFNPSIKLPAFLSQHEGELRERLRQKVSRGHVTLSVKTERLRVLDAAVDEKVFAAYVEQLRKLSERHSLGELDVGIVLRLPGVISTAQEEESEVAANDLLDIVDAAVRALESMRVAEGGRLHDYLIARLEIFEQALARIETRAPIRLVEQRNRMRAAVADLMNGIAVDEQRIAQEIAILADRLDISEETGRLRSHLTAFGAALEESAVEPVGKRLGFILQEMLREVNTIGSKGADSEILRDVVQLKEELERIREQAENVE